jgi:hypothetical protein
MGCGRGVAGPIAVLLLLAKPLRLACHMLLMGITNVAITVFGIPTGIIADKVGRRISVAIRTVLGSIALAIWWLARPRFDRDYVPRSAMVRWCDGAARRAQASRSAWPEQVLPCSLPNRGLVGRVWPNGIWPLRESPGHWEAWGCGVV